MLRANVDIVVDATSCASLIYHHATSHLTVGVFLLEGKGANVIFLAVCISVVRPIFKTLERCATVSFALFVYNCGSSAKIKDERAKRRLR